MKQLRKINFKIVTIASLLFSSQCLFGFDDLNVSEIYFQKAELLRKKNNIDEAIEFYKKSITKDSKNYKAYLRMGHLFKKKNNLDQAAAYTKKALEIKPQNLEACLYVAYLYHIQEKLDEAIPFYEKALEINKNCSTALRNLSKLYRQKEQPEKAIPLYKRAIDLHFDDEMAHFGLAQAYLALGNFKDGLHELELGRANYINGIKRPLIDVSQIPGKTILIPKGWGYGDMIQFCRFAKLIKECGGKVLFHPHKPVSQIIASCKYIDQITLERPARTDYDLEISLWSLSHLFVANEKNIPCEIPYIYADPNLVYLWSKRLSKDTNFKIGICWEGSSTLKYKDVPLEKFASIAKIPGVSLYSFQKGHGQEQIKNVNFHITDFGHDLDEKHGGFMDTAAIMKNIDLVITADTSVAHLAGAMGVPVWVMLPFGPDWRWMLKRTDSPWYKDVMLFRQPKIGDWDTVINNITNKLEGMLHIS